MAMPHELDSQGRTQTTMPEPKDESRSPFPGWLKDLVYFGGIIVALVVFGQNQRSDLRSAKEQLDRVAQDVTVIRQSVPNPEVLNMRFNQIETKISDLKSTVDFEAAKTQSLRERLIKKGWID